MRLTRSPFIDNVASVTSEDLNMPVNTEPIKGPPKLSGMFQLTVWSVIGMILGQKGAISVGEQTNPRNHTRDAQEKLTKLTKWGDHEWIGGSTVTQDRFKVGKLQAEDEENHVAIEMLDRVMANRQRPRKFHITHPPTHISREMFRIASTIDKRDTIEHEHGRGRGHEPEHKCQDEYDTSRGVRSIQISAVYASNKNESERGSKTETLDNEKSMSKDTASPSFNLVPLNRTNFFERESNETWQENMQSSKSDRKSLRSPVSRFGAAVAIIMLAIGIVMFLLGPLIVIVRIFTNRRRSRGTSIKSRHYTDHPPTYEQATLMDRAPSYSTLHLHTLHPPSHSSSSSSFTPSLPLPP